MDGDDQFLNQVLSGISEAEIITIFFPLLRRALIIDTRHSDGLGHMVGVLPQVGSMEERIAVIEQLRPQFGKVRSIISIPWIKPISSLREQGITDRLIERLSDAQMPSSIAYDAVRGAVNQLSKVEHRAFVALIQGKGYETLWIAHL